jgi:pyruvate,water dikinase
MSRYIRTFLEIGLHDVGLVGGKTASLGELYSTLASEGVAVPNGFAVTADAYRDALLRRGIADELHRLLDGLDKRKIKQLAAERGRQRPGI